MKRDRVAVVVASALLLVAGCLSAARRERSALAFTVAPWKAAGEIDSPCPVGRGLTDLVLYDPSGGSLRVGPGAICLVKRDGKGIQALLTPDAAAAVSVRLDEYVRDSRAREGGPSSAGYWQ